MGELGSFEPGCFSENAQMRLVGLSERVLAGSEKTALLAVVFEYVLAVSNVARRLRDDGTDIMRYCTHNTRAAATYRWAACSH